MGICDLYKENLLLGVLKPTKKAITILKYFELNMSKRTINEKSSNPLLLFKKSFPQFYLSDNVELNLNPVLPGNSQVKEFLFFVFGGNTQINKDWSALGYSEIHIHPSS